ncbi:hypothetical protein SB816_31205, partial [Achromobacter sp. SIMBA_011]
PDKRRIFYQQLSTLLEQSNCKTQTQIQQYLASLTQVMAKFSKNTQGENFSVDLKTGKVF